MIRQTQLVAFGLAMALTGLPASGQEPVYIDGAALSAAFEGGQIWCYNPDEAGACAWTEVYGAPKDGRVTIRLHYSLGGAEMGVTEALHLLEGGQLCSLAWSPETIRLFSYEDPERRARGVKNLKSAQQYSDQEVADLSVAVNAEPETGACFRYQPLIGGLRQFTFVNGIPFGEPDTILILPAGTPITLQLPQ